MQSDHNPDPDPANCEYSIKSEPSSNFKEKTHLLNFECTMNSHDLKEKIYHYIGSFTQAPNFIKDNKFILNGYRINFNSAKSILKSLFMLHNELVNIWTHLIGAVFVVMLIFYLAIYLRPIFPHFKGQIQGEINKYFAPIYSELQNLENTLNQKTRYQVDKMQKDFSFYKEDINKKYKEYNEAFSMKLESFYIEMDEIKSNINQKNAKRNFEKIRSSLQDLLTTLQSQLEEIPSKIPNMPTDYINKIVVEGKQSIKKSLEETRNFFLSKIDSEEYDWIDIYKSLSPSSSDRPSMISRWPIFIFLVSAILCLLFSSLFHLFCSMSKEVCNKMQYLDYAGISLLISGSTFPPLVYGFYCQPEYYTVYESVIGGACLFVFVISLFEFIHKPEYRKLKGILYGSLGIFAALPSTHLIYNQIYVSQLENSETSFSFNSALPYYLMMGFFYLLGLVIYVVQCPERWKPGKFDILGSSHQFWHLCVLIAIILTYFGSLEVLYSRKRAECYI